MTPSYNQARFLEATIRSVLCQDYANLEYLVIDGGSTDGSVSIIRHYEPLLAGWVSEKDRGQAHAINKGFARAGGQIFAWLNSDDVLLPDAVAGMARLAVRRPDAVAWLGACYRVRPDGQVLNHIEPRGLERDQLADWWHSGFFYQPSCFFSAEAWRESGGLDESLFCALDFDLWMKLSARGSFVSTKEAWSAATIHDDGKTQAYRARSIAETAVVQVKHGYSELAVRRLSQYLKKPGLKDRLERALRRVYYRSLKRGVRIS